MVRVTPVSTVTELVTRWTSAADHVVSAEIAPECGTTAALTKETLLQTRNMEQKKMMCNNCRDEVNFVMTVSVCFSFIPYSIFVLSNLSRSLLYAYLFSIIHNAGCNLISCQSSWYFSKETVNGNSLTPDGFYSHSLLLFYLYTHYKKEKGESPVKNFPPEEHSTSDYVISYSH